MGNSSEERAPQGSPRSPLGLHSSCPEQSFFWIPQSAMAGSSFLSRLLGFPKTSNLSPYLWICFWENLRQGHSFHQMPISEQLYQGRLELGRRVGSAAGGFSDEHGAKTLNICSSLPLLTTKLASGGDLCGQHVQIFPAVHFCLRQNLTVGTL